MPGLALAECRKLAPCMMNFMSLYWSEVHVDPLALLKSTPTLGCFATYTPVAMSIPPSVAMKTEYASETVCNTKQYSVCALNGIV